MKTFPIDVVNIILEYQGYHTYRHGKYIKKIDNNDERYKLLKTIPKIKNVLLIIFTHYYYVKNNLYVKKIYVL